MKNGWQMGLTMRVIAGKARSLNLKSPVGEDTRPTTDRIKETLFNILQPHLADCVFVDLFSGSGAIGIEALSRGAAKCYFVENGQNAFTSMMDNITFTKLIDESIILKQDVFFAVKNSINEKVDIIFMDPPYNIECEKKVLEILSNKASIDNNTLIVVESSLETDLSYVSQLGFSITKEKKYKTNKHTFLYKI
ncbi:MAG TPA: 16S rRNA (guanine(966)-N(2))-methyltransferase RsmD [Lachnospiraceae bacterium]|nr:16S rRNA (guanine(966)-N(2))-methyltransferase RsmD [Lachnospiraceae bacterium]